MIVLDESIHDPLIMDAVAAWYRGQVLSVRQLRTGTLVKDDAIPTLLGRVVQPTFVTINVDDFWRKTSPSTRYCILALDWEQSKALELPTALRQILHLPELRTKATRMGKVIRVRPSLIEYYESDRQIQTIAPSP